MKKALILDAQNEVENAVVVDENAIPAHLSSAILRAMDAPEGVGWTYDPQTDEFTDPTPEPEPVDWTREPLSRFEFLKGFSTQERITIRNSTDPIITDAMELFREAGAIYLAYQDTQDLIGYMAQQGVLTPARAAEILSGDWVEAVRAAKIG